MKNIYLVNMTLEINSAYKVVKPADIWIIGKKLFASKLNFEKKFKGNLLPFFLWVEFF